MPLLSCNMAWALSLLTLVVMLLVAFAPSRHGSISKQTFMERSLPDEDVKQEGIGAEEASRMLASDIQPKGLRNLVANTYHNFETIGLPTCAEELEVRKFFSLPHDPLHHGSEMLRLVFHDVLDFNNLQDSTGTRLSVKEPYGGVDGCLFSSVVVNEDGSVGPDPGHNNGLRHSVRITSMAQKRFPNISKADLNIAGALAAMEEDARGPHVPMTWGRNVPEDCEIRAGRYENNLDTNMGSTEWIHLSPDLLSFAPEKVFDVFQNLGFTQKEMIALMGAHSYGSVSQCSKVLNRVEVGNFCNKGNVKPLHWETVGGHKQTRPVGKMDENGNNITKPGTKGKWLEPTRKFDDGAFWDQTPSCLDNRYFQTFANANYEWKDGCCGISGVSSRRRRKNRMVNKNDYCKAGRGRKNDPRQAQFLNGTNRDICSESHPWCRSNWPFDGELRRDKTTMRNVFDYAFDDHQVLPNQSGFYPLEAGKMKPLFRLPPEWSLLANSTSKALLQEFAASEVAFFDAFHDAFVKLLQMTPQKDSLQSCAKTACTFDHVSKAFSCGGSDFQVDSIACTAPSGNATCSMVQVLGTRAVIECDNGPNNQDERLCCEGGGCTRPLRAWQHRKRLAGTAVALGTCFDDKDRTSPSVGDTAKLRDNDFRDAQR